MKKKNVMVLWSGGLDSTYIVYKNLKEGNIVKPIYGEIINNEDKTLIEKQQINILSDLLREDFHDLEYIEYPVKVDVDNSGDTRFKQLPVWLTTIMYSCRKNIDEIHVGYVMNDDMVSHIDDLKKTYNSLSFLYDFKLPKLIFPLLKIKKEEIVGLLPKRYLKQTYSCEGVKILNKEPKDEITLTKKSGKKKDLLKYELCGTCSACERRKKLGIDDSDLYVKEKSKNIGLTKNVVDSLRIYSTPGKQLTMFDIEDDFEETFSKKEFSSKLIEA